MKKTKILWLQLLALTFVSLIFQSISLADGHKKIFIVHSYEDGHICGQPQHDGAINALFEAGWQEGKNLQIATYHMDTKKKNNTPKLIQEQADLALAKLKEFGPDLVITLDDNAFRTIALPLAGSSEKIVFSGLNGQPETYNEKVKFINSRELPGGNITGVYEKLYIREAIQVLSTMKPMDTLVYLGDQSPTGKAISIQFDLEVEPDETNTALPTKLNKKIIHTWEEFTNTIEFINTNDQIGGFYLGTLLLKDSNGITYTASDIIDYTLEHAKKPAIGLNYAFIKLGLFGGATVDFYAMGQLVGEKAAQILNGQSPGVIPIEDAPRMALVFNLERAEKLGLTIPPDVLLAADEVFRK